jgi:hypothetical protein
VVPFGWVSVNPIDRSVTLKGDSDHGSGIFAAEIREERRALSGRGGVND